MPPPKRPTVEGDVEALFRYKYIECILHIWTRTYSRLPPDNVLQAKFKYKQKKVKINPLRGQNEAVKHMGPLDFMPRSSNVI